MESKHAALAPAPHTPSKVENHLRSRVTRSCSPKPRLAGFASRGSRAIARRQFLWLAVFVLAASRAGDAVSVTAPAPRNSPEEEGRRLAAELRRTPPALSTSGTLRRRDPSGRWQPALPVQLEIRGDDARWESFYRVFAPSGALIETLSVARGATDGNQYTLRHATDADRTLSGRTLQGNAAAMPFGGSDFWLCDLGLEFLHWPAQRITKTEMRKGRSCRVLESTNPHPTSGVYARVLAWVDLESGGLLRAEAFDPEGRLMKEFNIGSLKKVNGHFQLKSMEIRDARTDTRTRLEFELEIEE